MLKDLYKQAKETNKHNIDTLIGFIIGILVFLALQIWISQLIINDLSRIFNGPVFSYFNIIELYVLLAFLRKAHKKNEKSKL